MSPGISSGIGRKTSKRLKLSIIFWSGLLEEEQEGEEDAYCKDILEKATSFSYEFI